ncbi:MAG TPA: flagellar basal body rod protein FlgC [Alphaproteobacteria bacterium]|nr:flagellar basal body rod protein FlgC [Rhodospirillaceae bacterium]HRJ11919.1 flagellar basal body rod protein FlgC [Alphaproteobacteria bacterium]
MELSASMSIAASGMSAQAQRIKVIAQNIANADSTAVQPGEDPYRRQMVSFKNVFDREMGANVLKVGGIVQDKSEFRTRFDPSHPAADASGYIKLPNVSTVLETADLREAQRSYEASLAAMDLVKAMVAQTINSIRA